ncbi:MAG: hypothetical protein ACTH6D_00040 [Vibrio litoralis]
MPNQQEQLNKAKASIINYKQISASQDSKLATAPEQGDMAELIEAIQTVVTIEVERAVKAEFAKRDGQQAPAANSLKTDVGAPDPSKYFGANHDSKPESGAPKADDYF